MHDRLRRARPWLVLAFVLPVAIELAVAVWATATSTNVVPTGWLIPLGLMAFAYWFLRNRWLRPSAWLLPATAVGLVAGCGAGPAVADALSTQDSHTTMVLSVVVGAAVGGLLSNRLAHHARRVVLSASAAELIDSPVELGYRSREQRLPVRLRLLVREREVAFVGRRGVNRLFEVTAPLADVAAEPCVLDEGRTCTVPGPLLRRVYPVAAGPALRLTVPAGEWIFPTDQADEIRAALGSRAGR